MLSLLLFHIQQCLWLSPLINSQQSHKDCSWYCIYIAWKICKEKEVFTIKETLGLIFRMLAISKQSHGAIIIVYCLLFIVYCFVLKIHHYTITSNHNCILQGLAVAATRTNMYTPVNGSFWWSALWFISMIANFFLFWMFRASVRGSPRSVYN